MCSVVPFLFQYRNLAPPLVIHWSTVLELQSDFTVLRETPWSSGAYKCCILTSYCHLHWTHRRQSKVHYASLPMLPISAGDLSTVLHKPHICFVDVCTVLCKKKYKKHAFHWLPVILLDLLLRFLIWLSQSPYLPTTSVGMSSFPGVSLSKISPFLNSVLLICWFLICSFSSLSFISIVPSLLPLGGIKVNLSNFILFSFFFVQRSGM